MEQGGGSLEKNGGIKAAVLSHSDFTLQRIFGSVELFALLQLLARGRRCSATTT